MAVVGFIVSLPVSLQYYHDGFLTVGEIIVNSLDLVTITVPPALPTCLAIGVSLALHRYVKRVILIKFTHVILIKFTCVILI